MVCRAGRAFLSSAYAIASKADAAGAMITLLEFHL